MDDKFLVGVILGMVGGAFIATNSNKARQAVKDGQERIIEKAQDLQQKAKSQSSGKNAE